jgi:hypothetical protein
MSDIDPDVLAQMKRIWSAVNDGTLDKDTVNDALAQMQTLLTGITEPDPEPTANEEEVHDAGSEAPPTHARKPRKKR